MLVLVISDNHGVTGRMADVISRVKPDLMVHLGDSQMSPGALQAMAQCPVELVAGNCDHSGGIPREKIIEIGGLRAFISHGDQYWVRSGPQYIQSVARKKGCQLAMYGHTHIPLLEQSSDVVAFNPGSISVPRQGDGIGTYGLIEIDSRGQAHYTLCRYYRVEKN